LPNRIIRESITTSNSWDRLSYAAEAFCTRLITVVDDYGRLDARPSVLRAKCFPLKLAEVSESKIARWLSELIEARLVVVYVGEHGGQFLQFVNWTKYQNVRARESRYPAPPDHLIASAINCDQMIADVPVLVLGSRNSDLGSRDTGTSARNGSQAAPRIPTILDEDRAYEDAAKKGYNRTETTDMLEAFRDYWQSKGWRDKDGPLKDLNSRFRHWVRNQIDYGHLPSGLPDGFTSAEEQEAEANRQAKAARLDREAEAERDFQERLATTQRINREREERQRAALMAS
jgi:hypothetical protein